MNINYKLAILISLFLASCTVKPGTKLSEDDKSIMNNSNASSSKIITDSSKSNNSALPFDNSGKKVSCNQLESIQIDAQKQIKYPGATVLINVNSEPLTLGQYREAIQLRQAAIQTQMLTNPMIVSHLLEIAKKDKITLSQDEKNQLMKHAQVAEDTKGSFLNKEMKKDNALKQQFNDQVLDTALAFKAATYEIQKNLLAEMVNNKLFVEQAKKDGFEKTAYQDFVDFKHNNDIKKYANENNMTPAQFKQNYIDQALVKLEIEKIVGKPNIKDTQIQEFYQTHKDEFKHGERVQLKQVIVLAPQSGGPGFKSIKELVKEKNPKLAGKELDEKIKEYDDLQRQKADLLLAQLKQGVSFDKINPNNQKDIFVDSGDSKKAFKYEVASMPQEMKAEVDKLKNGQICPKIFKTQVGYQIIMLVDREPKGILPLDEVKPSIVQYLTQRQAQEIVASWLDNIRKSADIVLSKECLAMLDKPNGDKNATSNQPAKEAPKEASKDIVKDKKTK